MLKTHLIILILFSVNYVESYSSFWAPLYDPKILNYRVNVIFPPNVDVRVKEKYQNKFGFRGEKLIANLGNGKGVENELDSQNYDPVTFYYTYPGAKKQGY